MIDFQKTFWENFGDDAVPYQTVHTIDSGMMVFIAMIAILFIGAVIYEKRK